MQPLGRINPFKSRGYVTKKYRNRKIAVFLLISCFGVDNLACHKSVNVGNELINHRNRNIELAVTVRVLLYSASFEVIFAEVGGGYARCFFEKAHKMHVAFVAAGMRDCSNGHIR